MTFDDLLALAPTPAARDRFVELAEAAHQARSRGSADADARLEEAARMLDGWGRGARFPMPDRGALSAVIAGRFG